MKTYDFENLLTEWDFSEIKRQVEKCEIFEFVRLDKANKIELRIGLRRCDYDWWQSGVYCFVDGAKKCGDYHGFGRPYQRAEFLGLQYADIVQMFGCYGYELPKIKQLSIENFFIY
jgi:hypothetical protein